MQEILKELDTCCVDDYHHLINNDINTVLSNFSVNRIKLFVAFFYYSKNYLLEPCDNKKEILNEMYEYSFCDDLLASNISLLIYKTKEKFENDVPELEQNFIDKFSFVFV